MVDNVNPIGVVNSSPYYVNYDNTYSIRKIPAYSQFYAQYAASDTNLSFISWCESKGYAKVLLQQLENYIETGNSLTDNKWLYAIEECKQLQSSTSSLFQSGDGDIFFEVDWTTGQLKMLNQEEAFALMGVEAETVDKDTFSLGYNQAVITDYVFDNLEDGQQKTEKTIYSQKYGSKVKQVKQEFDLDYIFNAIWMDPSDPEFYIAQQIMSDLIDAKDQWLSLSEQVELDQIALQYGETSLQYKTKLKDLILKNLNQVAGAWKEGHAHIDRTREIDLSQFAPVEEEEYENLISETMLTELLAECGLDSLYNSDGTINTSKHYDNDTCIEYSANDARKRVDEELTKFIKALSDKLGDKLTDDMYLNMLKAKVAIVNSVCGKSGPSNWGGIDIGAIVGAALGAAVAVISGGVGVLGIAALAGIGTAAGSAVNLGVNQIVLALTDEDLSGLEVEASNIDDVLNVKTFGSGPLSDYGAKGQVKVKNMVDQFLRLFEALCKNGGKTDAQVAEEKEKTKKAYNTLNDKMSTTASSAGISDIKLVNATFSQLWQEANDKIITPFKEKIKGQMKDLGIPDEELQEILDFAGVEALYNPEKWASADYSGYSYTISAQKVIERFETVVKQIIKTKGY